MSRWVLAIETSITRGSVALAADGQLVEQCEIDATRRNAAGLLPAIEGILATHGVKIGELAALAFSAGPGSFTGVRVAATVARMLNAVARVPVVKAPTLQALAARAGDGMRRPTHVAAMLDAKRGQVFAAAYECVGDEWVERLAPAIHEAAEFLQLLQSAARTTWLATGEGVAAQREIVDRSGIEVCEEQLWRPDAAAVLRAAWPRLQRGEFCRPEEIVPIYLRPPECEEVYEQRRAAAKAKRGEGVTAKSNAVTPSGGAE